jgi:hypothetical protein
MIVAGFLRKASLARRGSIPHVCGRAQSLHCYGALQAFFLQGAAYFVRPVYVAVHEVGVGVAAAAAVKARPAGGTFGFIEHMRPAKEIGRAHV